MSVLVSNTSLQADDLYLHPPLNVGQKILFVDPLRLSIVLLQTSERKGI